jgi:hypothetical protein
MPNAGNGKGFLLFLSAAAHYLDLVSCAAQSRHRYCYK